MPYLKRCSVVGSRPSNIVVEIPESPPYMVNTKAVCLCRWTQQSASELVWKHVHLMKLVQSDYNSAKVFDKAQSTFYSSRTRHDREQ